MTASTFIEETRNVADAGEIRQAAIQAGAMDPADLRFRVAEYDKHTGDFLSYVLSDASLNEAVEEVRQTVLGRPWSSFVLEPVGYIQ